MLIFWRGFWIENIAVDIGLPFNENETDCCDSAFGKNACRSSVTLPTLVCAVLKVRCASLPSLHTMSFSRLDQPDASKSLLNRCGASVTVIFPSLAMAGASRAYIDTQDADNTGSRSG